MLAKHTDIATVKTIKSPVFVSVRIILFYKNQINLFPCERSAQTQNIYRTSMVNFRSKESLQKTSTVLPLH